jgi:hypothetical protein
MMAQRRLIAAGPASDNQGCGFQADPRFAPQVMKVETEHQA